MRFIKIESAFIVIQLQQHANILQAWHGKSIFIFWAPVCDEISFLEIAISSPQLILKLLSQKQFYFNFKE